MTVKLRESSTLSAGSTKRRIRLISEGVGSSGMYPADTLERDGATAFPAGTQIFFDHLGESEEWERNGNHSIKDLVGVTLTDAVYEGDTRALFADASFFPTSAEFVNAASEYIGLSIEAAATINEGVVEAIHYSPLNAIAIVPRAGRDGKILQLIESYKESGKIENVKPDADKVREDARKEKGMTPEEIEKVAEALAAALAPAFVTLTEALKPVVPVVPEDEGTEGVDALEVAEALVEAFPESKVLRTRVAEAVKNGTPLADAIKAEKDLVEALKGDFEKVSDDDSVLKARESADKDFTTTSWIR